MKVFAVEYQITKLMIKVSNKYSIYLAEAMDKFARSTEKVISQY